MCLRRYKLTIAYDGTDFHGWQKQEPPDRDPLRTVGGVVCEALQRLLRQRIQLVGASRTDAGVHAEGQVAHFDAQIPIPIDRLAKALNSRLPGDVEAVSVEQVASNFDAIRSVHSKQYVYRIFNTVRRPLVNRHVVWHCWTPLDDGRMQEAAHRLIGEHDFSAFAAAGHGRTTTVRRILRCRVERDVRNASELHVLIEGDGFLYNMVRIIAGTLVEVGRGRFDVNIIDRMLSECDRSLGGPTLPPQGLCLQWVRY
ncbi:MAG: tRNA pseudouridine(38-40) synthase TruA [Phycisphaeraceae bacterium]|nr:tRNA pseudouridine(38-40) synthase TruA [Phycisphaeraceae bacterium]